MKYLLSGAAIVAMSCLPMTANAQLIGGLDNGALLGGVVGAGIGGAVGSNLAGTGVQDEGTAIGALLGGAAGYALASQRGHRAGGPGYVGPGGYAPGYGGPGYGGQGYRGPGYGGPGYGGPAYGGPVVQSSRYGGSSGYAYGYEYGHQWGGVSAPAIMPAPTMIHSGQYIAGPIIPVTTQIVQPQTVYTAPINYGGFTYADSSVRLSGPPLEKRVVRHSTYVEHAPIVRAERVVIEGNCPTGTSRQYDGTCLDPTVTALPPLPRTNTRSTCPAGTYRQTDGICLNPSVTVMPPPVIAPPKRAIRHHAPAPKIRYHHPAPKVKHQKPAPVVHHKNATQYCYPGSNKRYDRRGRLIQSGGTHCSN